MADMFDFVFTISVSTTIVGAIAMYGLVRWLMGTPQDREKAKDMWEYAVESAILSAIGFFVIMPIAMWIAYQMQTSMYPNYTVIPPIDSPWDVLTQEVPIKALENAATVFDNVGDSAVKDLGHLTQWIVGLGVIPFTQTLSMALAQYGGILYATATPAAIMSWFMRYLAWLVEILLGAFPVLAVLLATGRRILAPLGAALMAFATVAAAAMPVAAAAILHAQNSGEYKIPMPTLTIPFTNYSLGDLAAIARSPFYASVLVTYSMLLTVIVTAGSTLAYALSGIPHAFEALF